MRVVFRAPTEADLDALAASMRPMDVKECDLIAGCAPREALAQCVANAEWSTVALIDGAPVCVFGLSEASFLGGDAYPWMLCTKGIERHARTLLTCAPRFLGEMQAQSERLSNVVHGHNHSAIRFLRWCGFSFGEVFEVKGEPFLRFSWERQVANHAMVAA